MDKIENILCRILLNQCVIMFSLSKIDSPSEERLYDSILESTNLVNEITSATNNREKNIETFNQPLDT